MAWRESTGTPAGRLPETFRHACVCVGCCSHMEMHVFPSIAPHIEPGPQLRRWLNILDDGQLSSEFGPLCWGQCLYTCLSSSCGRVGQLWGELWRNRPGRVRTAPYLPCARFLEVPLFLHVSSVCLVFLMLLVFVTPLSPDISISSRSGKPGSPDGPTRNMRKSMRTRRNSSENDSACRTTVHAWFSYLLLRAFLLCLQLLRAHRAFLISWSLRRRSSRSVQTSSQQAFRCSHTFEMLSDLPRESLGHVVPIRAEFVRAFAPGYSVQPFAAHAFPR